jgi:hypothetical protein
VEGAAPAEEQSCFRCGVALPPGALHCPRCGRPQFRVCRCGNRNPLGTTECPVCGLRWSPERRTRKKSRSEKVDWRLLARYVVVGVAVALIASVFVGTVVTGLAQRALPPDTTLPASLWGRLGLAGHGLTMWLAHIAHRLGRAAAGGIPVLVAIGVGALAGTLVYLAHLGVLRLPGKRRSSSSNRNRRRRT